MAAGLRLALVAAGAGLLAAAAPASAQAPGIVVTGKVPSGHKIPEGYEAVKKTVKIADLDLATSAGKAAMERRVGRAVEQICATPKPIGNYEKRMSRQCSDMAWESARPQMDRAVRRARRS